MSNVEGEEGEECARRGGESISIWRISPPVTKFSLADSPPGHAQRVRRCFTGSKHRMGGRGTRPIQCKICTLTQIIFIGAFNRHLLAAGHFCKLRFWKCACIALTRVYILRIFAIKQRFDVFVFYDVEMCQIAWFDGCIGAPSIGIRKLKNAQKIIVEKWKERKGSLVQTLMLITLRCFKDDEGIHCGCNSFKRKSKNGKLFQRKNICKKVLIAIEMWSFEVHFP